MESKRWRVSDLISQAPPGLPYKELQWVNLDLAGEQPSEVFLKETRPVVL